MRDVTDFEACTEVRWHIRLNVSASWTAGLTLFSDRDSAFSPSKHFSTLPLTTCHDFCPELDIGDGMIAQRPNKTPFFSLNRRGKFVWCLSSACAHGWASVWQVLLARLPGTWNFKTILDIFLKDWTQCYFFIIFFLNLQYLMANVFCEMKFHFDVQRAHLCRLVMLEEDSATLFLMDVNKKN